MPAGTGRARRAFGPGIWAALAVPAALLVTGCQTTQSNTTAQPARSVSSASLAAQTAQCLDGGNLTEQVSGVLAATAPAFNSRPPVRVAVLPFAVASDEAKNVAEHQQANAFQVTTTFRNHFSHLPYQDVEWEAIRKVAERRGLSIDGTGAEDALSDVARELNADTVLIGKVHRVERIFALAVGQIAAEAELKLIRLNDDCLLWHARHVVRHNKGGISLSPVGLALQAVQTALSLNEQAQIAAVDELARDLASAAPVPVGETAKLQATLLTASHSAEGGAVRAGQALAFSIAVDRSLAQISARVGENFRVPLAEQEAKDGVYVYSGSRNVAAGDDVADAAVRYAGVDDLGNEVDFVDPSGTISIDTMPPDAPQGIRANFADKRIRLTWDVVSASDLAAYEIWRSAQPLGGFQRIGESQAASFDDANPLARVGYYQVRARDKAGNLSPTGEAVAGRQIKPGPTVVATTIDRDTTWYAAASPYIINGLVNVARGVKLTVEPGTRIQVGAGGGVRVDGQLLAVGASGAPISWAPGDGAENWDGLRIDSAVAGAASRIEGNEFSGATVALRVRSADPVLRGNAFLRNGTGLVIENTADPELADNTFRNNGIALRIVAADPLLEGNRFLHNTAAAIEVVGASPVIRENVFRDNGGPGIKVRQQARSSILEASLNWWGTIERSAVAGQIDGAVNFEPVLDAEPPAGKAVAAIDSQPAAEKPQVAESAPAANPAQAMLTGLQLMEQGKPREALAMLQPLEDDAAGNPILQYTLSLLYFETGNPAGALTAIDRAVASNPAAPNFHLSRAQILRALDRQGEAREALATVLRLQPGNRTAQVLMGTPTS